MEPTFSVLIPARNEERYIGRCLESVKCAASSFPREVEIIVCLNRCTDRTGEIAESYGARTVVCDAKNLSVIRNVAALSSTGKVLVTIDADSVMTRNLLAEVERALDSGCYVGGGVWIRPERLSFGIALTGFLLLPYMLFYLGISCGAFWCRREDFDAIGGFDESILSAEDINFAVRLKAYGRDCGKKYGTLCRANITTSCRKFDLFGDWYAFKHPLAFLSLLRGRNREWADRVWYDVKR